MAHKNVVITGFGAVTPFGIRSQNMWMGLNNGKSAITPITAFDPAGFDCRIAGQIPEFNIRDYVPKNHRKATKLMSRDIELSIIAAHEALKTSGIVTKGLDPENINVDPTRMAINLGAGLISCDLIELAPAVAQSITEGRFDILKWGKQGLECVTPLWLLKYLPKMLACHIGIIHDIQGPSNTITCAETSALLAVAEAASVIQRGASDIAIAGAAEAKVNPIVMIRQCLLKRATLQNNDNPEKACRPFDADAKGSVFGEAAGIVILENLQNAKNRNAKIYAELVGIGQSSSINPKYENLEPDGRGIRIAIEKAVNDAGIDPKDIDLIIPHGTGIPEDDLAEAKAICNALGPAAKDIPVFPTKSMLSNTGAASGVLDLITAICAMRDRKIPAARNCENKADGCELNITTSPLQKNIKYALSCTYTYGGQTAALIIKNFDNVKND